MNFLLISDDWQFLKLFFKVGDASSWRAKKSNHGVFLDVLGEVSKIIPFLFQKIRLKSWSTAYVKVTVYWWNFSPVVRTCSPELKNYFTKISMSGRLCNIHFVFLFNYFSFSFLIVITAMRPLKLAIVATSSGVLLHFFDGGFRRLDCYFISRWRILT